MHVDIQVIAVTYLFCVTTDSKCCAHSEMDFMHAWMHGCRWLHGLCLVGSCHSVSQHLP
jgi:hypothetical protein